MLAIILRRLLYAVPVALGLSVVCFSLVYLAPGNPLQTILPADASADIIALIEHEYGFDWPIPIQFLYWMGHVLQGDFGVSIATQRPVVVEALGSLANVITLTSFAIPISFTIVYSLGAIAGCFPGTWLDRLVAGSTVMGVSLPNYWVGIVVVIIFSVEWMVLPATGMGPKGAAAFSIFDIAGLKFRILPVITLAMVPVGILARSPRAAVADVRGQDFVITLRAKGLGEFAIIRDILKNAMPPVLAAMGLQFNYLMGGSILVETVFTWPGSGFLLNNAIISRDIPVLHCTILMLAMMFVAANLVVDLLQAAIAPRIRRA